MNHTELLNALIKKFGYKSYLEIGSQNPANNFDHIEAEHKVAVDPFPQGFATFVGTSDEYFDSLPPFIMFDLVFIDGLHHDDQVLVDIFNSLRHLTDNGTIVCHDCLPSTEFMQVREDNHSGWTGDVWKAIAHLRITFPNADIFVIDTDMGCGIIRQGYNELYVPDGDWRSYEYYDKHKKEMMNVISIEEFKQWLEKTNG